MNGRLAGLSIILYAFMNAYFGVGATKYSITGHSLPLTDLLPGVVYSLSWIFYFTGGAGLLFNKRWSLYIIMAASLGSAATTLYAVFQYVTEAAIPINPQIPFLLTRPVPEIFIFCSMVYLLRKDVFSFNADQTLASSDQQKRRGFGRNPFGMVTIASGAAMPWLVGILKWLITGSQWGLNLGETKGIFIAVFMTVWFDMPFMIIVLVSRAISLFEDNGTTINPATEYHEPSSSLVGDWKVKHTECKEGFRTGRNDKIKAFNGLVSNRSGYALKGAVIGALIACLYVFSLMWGPPFQSFLMAISPSLIFAGASIGAVAGGFTRRILAKKT